MYSTDLVMIIEKTTFIYICHLFVNIELKLTFYWLDHIWAVCSELFHALSIFAVKLEKWMNLCLLINYNYFAHSIFVDINSFTLVSRQYSLSSCGTCIHFSIKTLLIIILLLPVYFKHFCG